jgi:hypothetical protein
MTRVVLVTTARVTCDAHNAWSQSVHVYAQHVRPASQLAPPGDVLQHVSHAPAKQSYGPVSDEQGDGGAGTQQKFPRDAPGGMQSAWMSAVGSVPTGQLAHLPSTHVPPSAAQRVVVATASATVVASRVSCGIASLGIGGASPARAPSYVARSPASPRVGLASSVDPEPELALSPSTIPPQEDQANRPNARNTQRTPPST